MNTLLIGLRGCGKSTIGRLLATRLQTGFVDLDNQTLASFDETTVSEIWTTHGEAAWRDAEVNALQTVLATNDQVVASGGGTPMIAGAHKLIRTHQADNRLRVIYLHCETSQLAARMRAQPGDRPSLTGDDFIEEIEAVAARRLSTFRALADSVVDVTNQTPDEVVDVLFEDSESGN